MCDDLTNADNERALAANPTWNRRRFTAVTSVAAAAALLPGCAVDGAGAQDTSADPLTRRDVRITTPDGEADAWYVAPAAGRHPAVLVWPDIVGLRPAFQAMGQRLAGAGYAVLVVNPFYRQVRAPVVPPGSSFRDPDTRAVLLPLARALNADTHRSDALAFLSWLDEQPEVDRARKAGVMGYCMGGPMTLRTAAALPDRIGAAASFHGGRLVTDAADSPHRSIPEMRARFLIAVAENDDEREPDTKNVLRDEFAAAGLAAEIEVYEGALHGWCPPDSAVYNEAQAERAWSRLLVLFEGGLT